MALVGMGIGKDEQRLGYKAPTKEVSTFKKVVDKSQKIVNNTTKTAMFLDKTKETTLSKSGLLSSVDFTFIDKRGTPVNPFNPNTYDTQLNMFERKPMPSSGTTIAHDIYDLGKGAFTGGAYDRVQVNPEALQHFEQEFGDLGIQKIGDKLNSKGFNEKQIRTILGSDLQNKWSPTSAIDSSMLSNISPTNPLSGSITQPSSNTKALDSLNNLIKDSVINADESLKGRVPSDYLKSGFDMPLTEKVLDVASNIKDYGGQTGEKISNVLEYGGQAKSLLGKLGQVGGGIKAVKGVVELIAGDDKYQGVEDIVQGAIAFASPALIAAGPAGWAVLGLSAIEDMFLEDVIDFDW